MTASQQQPPEHGAPSGQVLEDLFRGVEPIRGAEDLACDGVFEDGELEAFLTDLHAVRHADTA